MFLSREYRRRPMKFNALKTTTLDLEGLYIKLVPVETDSSQTDACFKRLPHLVKFSEQS